jgi:hypothetical protein
MDLFPPERLPIVPDATLRAHRAHEPHDTRFRACARLLQSIWRERHGFPIGTYTTPKGRHRKLGSRLAAVPSSAGANFLDPAIRTLARRELAYREPGATIDEARVWSNLLSSMPLSFNLLGPLKLDDDLASAFVAALFPDLAGKVVHVVFEHSPARGDPKFTNDASAFDCFVTIRRDNGAKAFIGIEVKYSEGMVEPEARHRARYDDLACTSGLFIDPDAPELRRNPLQQLWRMHMLAQSLLDNELFDEGAFVVIAPRLNDAVQRATRTYANHLTTEPEKATFINLTLEDATDGLAAAGAGAYAQAFRERYIDFTPVHALI